MLTGIINWIKSLIFGQPAAPAGTTATTSPAIAAAGVAGTLIAANNKQKAAEALVYAEVALKAAKAGKLDNEQLQSILTSIKGKVDHPEYIALISAIQFPPVQLGTVNENLIDILEAFITGVRAGVK